jgi:hypothetical protein
MKRQARSHRTVKAICNNCGERFNRWRGDWQRRNTYVLCENCLPTVNEQNDYMQTHNLLRGAAKTQLVNAIFSAIKLTDQRHLDAINEHYDSGQDQF